MSHSMPSFESSYIKFPVKPDGDFIDEDERHFGSYSFDETTFTLNPIGEAVYRSESKQSENLRRALLVGANLATEYGSQIASSDLKLHDVETKNHGVQQFAYNRSLAIGFVKTDDKLAAFTEFVSSPDRPKNQPQKLACIMAESAVWLCSVPVARLEQFYNELVEAPKQPIEIQLETQKRIYSHWQ